MELEAEATSRITILLSSISKLKEPSKDDSKGKRRRSRRSSPQSLSFKTIGKKRILQKKFWTRLIQLNRCLAPFTSKTQQSSNSSQ